MKRFEQIIEDTYERLGLSEEKGEKDETTADNYGLISNQNIRFTQNESSVESDRENEEN